MFADVAHHTETNQHCLALGLGLIPMRRSDLREGDNESVSSSDCSQAARLRWVRRHNETQERAGPLRWITRGDIWSAFPLSCHDGATNEWRRSPLLLVSSVCSWPLWQRRSVKHVKATLCCFSAVKDQLCSTSFFGSHYIDFWIE